MTLLPLNRNYIQLLYITINYLVYKNDLLCSKQNNSLNSHHKVTYNVTILESSFVYTLYSLFINFYGSQNNKLRCFDNILCFIWLSKVYYLSVYHRSVALLPINRHIFLSSSKTFVNMTINMKIRRIIGKKATIVIKLIMWYTSITCMS